MLGVFKMNGRGLNSPKGDYLCNDERNRRQEATTSSGRRAGVADYEAERRALRERTERLRALRLARDAATNQLADAKKKKKK